MSIRIIVDSTADLTPDLRRRLTVIPLTIRFGDAEYLDGITITHREFYEKLVECDTLPTTSQATPDNFDAVFADVAAAGDQAVVITISSKLSGTYQSACIAAGDYPGSIFVVDGRSVAIGSGILAEYALQLVDRGLPAQAIVARLEEDRDNLRIIALLDTLEYLKKGGRISAATAVAGGILNIKPVVCLEGGEIKTLGKARGSRQGNNLLVTQIDACGGVDFARPVMLGYTGLSDALLQKYIQDSAALWAESPQSLRSTLIGSVVGTHVGPGAVAVAFFRKTG